MMLDKNTPQADKLAKAMYKAMEQIIADGAYYEILQKYYGTARIPGDWLPQLGRLISQYRNQRVIVNAN